MAAAGNAATRSSLPAFLAGDSAIGSPYFQSISLGFECAMYLAGLIARPELPLGAMLDRYELYIYKQWLRVYMRSKMIKHNKDLFEIARRPAGTPGQAPHLLKRVAFAGLPGVYVFVFEVFGRHRRRVASVEPSGLRDWARLPTTPDQPS